MEKFMQGSDQCYGQSWIAAARADRRAASGLVVIGIYGGILRFARGAENNGLIRKSGDRFSRKNMYEQVDKMMARCGLHRIVI
jgi:hypothetical protein